MQLHGKDRNTLVEQSLERYVIFWQLPVSVSVTFTASYQYWIGRYFSGSVEHYW